MWKKKLYGYVDDLMRSFGITYDDYPICGYKIAEKVKDLVVEKHQFYDLNVGAVLVKQSFSFLAVNTRKSPLEQNWDVMHELIHFYRHNGGKVYFSAVKARQNTFHEWEANEGAAQALVPYQLFIPHLLKKLPYLESWDYTYDDFIGYFSDMFKVLPIVIERRIENLEYEIYQAKNGIPIDGLIILSRNERMDLGIRYIGICNYLKKFKDVM
jgi:Zn-dependent peptidase ImmA (M78 family)